MFCFLNLVLCPSCFTLNKKDDFGIMLATVHIVCTKKTKFGKTQQSLLTIHGKVFRRLPTILFLFTQQVYFVAHQITDLLSAENHIGNNSIYHRRWNTAIFRYTLPMRGCFTNIIDNRCCIFDIVLGSKCQQVISGNIVELLID